MRANRVKLEHINDEFANADVALVIGDYTKNGGFAEYILADPDCVAHIPAGLSAAEAVPTRGSR